MKVDIKRSQSSGKMKSKNSVSSNGDSDPDCQMITNQLKKFNWKAQKQEISEDEDVDSV